MIYRGFLLRDLHLQNGHVIVFLKTFWLLGRIIKRNCYYKLICFLDLCRLLHRHLRYEFWELNLCLLLFAIIKVIIWILTSLHLEHWLHWLRVEQHLVEHWGLKLCLNLYFRWLNKILSVLDVYLVSLQHNWYWKSHIMRRFNANHRFL